MTAPLNEEIILALALPLLAVATQTAVTARNRFYSYAKTQCVARIVRMIMAKVEPTDEEIRSLRWRFTLGTILDAAIFISEHIYGNALHRLTLIVEVCEADFHLLHSVNSHWGRGKQMLAKLSCMTHATAVIEYAEKCLNEKCRDTHFYATAALISARPERAIRYIAQLEDALTWYEVALLTKLMRRASVPIAYTPLLTSQNRNLQLIGIYLCEHFSIVDAEPHLQRLAESEESDLAYPALLTLCSIRGNISSPQVGSTLARLAPHQRATFIRHAVQACYALNSCAKYLSREEQRLFRQQIDSYKCRIVCN
jgi:hypothetical protein